MVRIRSHSHLHLGLEDNVIHGTIKRIGFFAKEQANSWHPIEFAAFCKNRLRLHGTDGSQPKGMRSRRSGLENKGLEKKKKNLLNFRAKDDNDDNGFPVLRCKLRIAKA